MSTNPGQTDARAWRWFTPGILGPDFFEGTAASMNAVGAPDIEKLKAVLSKHWLVAALPGAMSSNR